MASEKITMFNDLNVLSQDYTIKVRIIRVWTRKLFTDPTKVFSYEMIIMDENCSRLEASVQRKYCVAYENLLSENMCLLVIRPSLAANNTKYKVFNTPHKITFTEKTVVMKCSDAVGSEYGFNFTPFANLTPKQTPEKTTVDIIGAVVKFSPIEVREKNDGKTSKMITLDLKDLQNKDMSVTLWDEYADQFANFLSENEGDRNLVVIVQFGKFRTFRELNQVSNAYNVTKVFINAQIHEIVDFKQRFISQSMSQSSSTQSGFSSSLMTSFKEEFLSATDFCNISDIHDIQTEKSVIILGTIKGFCDDSPWYYTSCRKCKSKVIEKVECTLKEDGSGDFDEVTILRCKLCEGETITPVPRYKISLRVQDSTGIVSLTLFDREAYRLLKVSANQLLDNNEELAAQGIIPVEFNSLIDRRFAMKIKVSNFNLETNIEYYTISKLTDDRDILSELDKKSDLLQNRDIQSVNTTIEDFESAPVATKDSYSCTGDDVTPLSKIDKAKNVSPITDEETPSSTLLTQDLKRNLQSVYDVDESSPHSATKPRISCNKDDGTVHCTTLLTPKIEK